MTRRYKITLLLLSFAALACGRAKDGSGESPPERQAVTGATASIAPSFTVKSRTSCIAPCSVFLDATGTTSTLTQDPFHDILYTWDFDDWGAGNWASGAGGGSKNFDIGPITGHLFETPGTYVIKLSTSIGGVTASTTRTVTVDDPFIVYKGRTYCYSNSNASIGNVPNKDLPSDCHLIPTAKFEEVIANIKKVGPNTYHMLHRGDKFTMTSTTNSSSSNIDVDGPGIIGDIGSSAANPVIVLQGARSSTDAALLFGGPNSQKQSGWVVKDITIDGSGDTNHAARGIGQVGGTQDLLILRVTGAAVNGLVSMRAAPVDALNNSSNPAVHGHVPHWGLAIVDCTYNLGTTGGTISFPYAAYIEAEQFWAAGNNFDLGTNTTATPDQGIRVAYGYKFALQHNSIASRNSLRVSALSSTASNWTTSYMGINGTSGGATRYGFISDNQAVLTTSNYNVAIGANADGDVILLQDLVLDGNWLEPPVGSTTQAALVTEGTRVTLRNNFVDTTGYRYHTGFVVGRQPGHSGATTTANLTWIYNNTLRNNDASNNFVAVVVDPFARNTIVANNLASSPADSSAVLAAGAIGAPATPPYTGGGLSLSNNSSNSQIRGTNNNLFVGDTSQPANWKLKTGSYAIGAGSSGVPVARDFFGTPRPSTPSIGASEPPALIAPLLLVNRSSCVAPCSIVFDATGTTSALTTYPFHEVLYSWDFGDPGAGNWTNGAKNGSKNIDTGALTGHVYEKPGTYKATLTASIKGAIVVTTHDIVVEDPNVAYAGKVYCYSNSDSTADDPPECAGHHIPTMTMEKVIQNINAVGSNAYHRLKRGDTFTLKTPTNTYADSLYIWPNGPGIIGDYGPAPTKPMVAVQISLGGNAAINFGGSSMPYQSGWVVKDVMIDASGALDHYAAGIGNNGATQNFLALRVTGYAVSVVVSFAGARLDGMNTNYNRQIFRPFWGLSIVDSDNSNTLPDATEHPLGLYVEAERFWAAGNHLDLKAGNTRDLSHGIRVPYGYRFALQHNTVAQSGNFQYSFKIHALSSTAPDWSTSLRGVRGNSGGATRYGLISDNKTWQAWGAYNAAAIAGESGDIVLVQDIIFDGNWFLPPTGSLASLAIVTEGTRVTIRNNLVDTTGYHYHSAFEVGRQPGHTGSTTTANTTWVYNNTIRNNDGSNNFAAVVIDQYATNTFVANNLVYSPHDLNAVLAAGGIAQTTLPPYSAGGLTLENNSTDAQVRTANANLFVGDTSTPVDWKPKVGSYPVHAGSTDVPVLNDFFWVQRPTPPSIGAAEP